jgi:hypothetical protein
MELMEALLDKINKHGADTKIPFAEVAELLGRAVPDKEAEQAALYLASNRVGMLKIGFEWLFNEGATERVALSDLQRALRTGAMSNPHTGASDPEFKSKIQVFFEISEQLQ